jgi:eukaryotic-like serine/threonine-protein kinase
MLASRGPLPPVGAARVAVQVCAALAAAHADGRTHGQLTPASILLRIDGQVRLTGFRLDQTTRPLAAVPDPEDDLRGLGRCMVVMLTGRQPTAGEPVPLGPEVPAELAAIVTRAAEGPPRGYRSAGDLGRDLARFLAAGSGAPAARRSGASPAAAGPAMAVGSATLLPSARVAPPKRPSGRGAAASPGRRRHGLAMTVGLVGAGLCLVGAVVAVGLVGGQPSWPDTGQAVAPPSTEALTITSRPAAGTAATTTAPPVTTAPLAAAPPVSTGPPGGGQVAGPGTRTVPDVVGLHRQRAVDVLTEAGFDVQIVRFQVRERGQAQRVVAQRPSAGRTVRAGSVVRLTVGTKRPSGEPVPSSP